MITEIEPEKIEENWKKFRMFCTKLGDRTEVVGVMLDELETRMALCPASSRLDRHLAVPGGLVDHSLRVLGNATILAKTFFADAKISKESLILTCLFHDLGKIGIEGDDAGNYYLPQDSSWHREKLGETYKQNRDILFMPHSHRSVYLLQHYGVKLTNEEFVAILIHDGQYSEDNKAYSMKEPPLATVISEADLLATKQEKLL
jgi:hypothetical protein